nr:MAG TPA: hypothetical protein [Caudoviricetes sp.]
MFYFEDFDNVTHEEIKAIIFEMIGNAKEDIHKWAEQKQENKRLVWIKENLSESQGRLKALTELCGSLGIELEE